MTVPALTPEEVEERGLNDSIVWYVYNETEKHASGFERRDGGEGRITPVFVEKEDAETCRFIVGKTAYLQNHVLTVKSAHLQDLIRDVDGEWEFHLQVWDGERAKKWFEEYGDITFRNDVFCEQCVS